MRRHDPHDETPGLRGPWCLFARVFRLLRSWWQADRVRISPSEGRLLRLRPPCIIRIGESYVQVRRRCTGQNVTGAYVLYDCLVDTQTAQLIVSPGPGTRREAIRWCCSGTSLALDPDDVEVFG